MSLTPESIVTIYADLMAFIIAFGLLFLAMQYRVGKDVHAGRLFMTMLVSLMFNAVTNGFSYAFHHQSFGWSAPVRMIMPTLAEISALFTLFAWFLYADYKVYGSWDRTKYLGKYFQIPVIVFEGLCIINIFYGFMFTVDENMVFVARPLFYVMMLAQYFYGVFPVVMILHYIRLHGKLHFFHLWPVVGPVVVSSIFTLLSPYSARAFGFAIALVFLYFSYIDRWRFDDFESGFYNKHYVDYLLATAEKENWDYHSAIFFDVDSTCEGLYEIFRQEVPNGGEIIRVAPLRFLLFSKSSKASMTKLLSAMILESANEYDERHPDSEPIDMVVSYIIRGRDESLEDFMRMAAAE